MAKNKAFKHKYTVTVHGRTTNEFLSSLFCDLINGIAKTWNGMYESTEVEVEKEIIK